VTNLPLTLPMASGQTPDERMARALLLAALNDAEVRKEIEARAGVPVFIESKDPAGNPAAAIDFGGLISFLGKIGPLLGALLPAIVGIFTGGFSPAAITAILTALMTFFGQSSPATQAIAALPGAPQP
jgi:hypothetical protein